MALFSVSNTLLKVITSKFDLVSVLTPFAPALAVGFAAFLAAALYLVNQGAKIPQELTLMLLLAIIVSIFGVAAFLASLQEGKVAAVTAILSLSTILVVFLSSNFIGTNYTLKEIAAMALAVVSIGLFVL